MDRGFGVGDLSELTGRLRRAGEDLDDAAVRTASLCVGRHGVLNPTTARAVQVLWADWMATVAEQAARCKELAAAVTEVSRDYRRTDGGMAGYPIAATASVDGVEGPLMADPGDAFAGMVATCHHLSIDIDTIARTIAGLPAAVEWWGSGLRQCGRSGRCGSPARRSPAVATWGVAATIWAAPAIRLHAPIDVRAEHPPRGVDPGQRRAVRGRLTLEVLHL